MQDALFGLEQPFNLPGKIFSANLDALCSQVERLADASPRFTQNRDFMSVGRPAYLSANDPDGYLKAALDTNEMLWTHFEDVYEQLQKILSAHFGEVVHFSHCAAIPGFHVIRLGDGRPYLGGVPHTDCSYRNVPAFAGPETAQDQHYSFTVLVSNEGNDIGLEYWRQAIDEDCAKELPPGSFVRYQRGRVLLFRSSILHRIPACRGRNGSSRITLQGHIIRVAARLVAYW